MQLARTFREPRSSGAYATVGLLAVAAYLVVLMVALERYSYDVWGGIAFAPILVVLTLPALRSQARRELDPTTFSFLVLAVSVKLSGAFLRYAMGLRDANVYSKWGSQIADGFRHGDFATGLKDLTGTDFIRFFTGIVYTGTGTTKLGGCVVYAWLGFWGLFFFYRAFVTAVPEGRRRTYGWMVFFLPSLVFWPSSIGKDAWMVFALGLATFGVAQLLTRWTVAGMIEVGGGLWLAALVRPHVAAMVGIAFLVAMTLRPSKHEHRELAPVLKYGAVVLVLLLAAALTMQTNGSLHIFGEGGVGGTLNDVSERTSKGGSDFEPWVVDNPMNFPMAAVTVLFRPFLFEAHNGDALLAALEGTVLLALFLFRFRWVLAALRTWRRQPYVVFCVAYVVGFIIAFSSFSNFGLLARERTQVLPLLLVLIAIPPVVRERPRRSAVPERVPALR
jgi:hypothetical protein